jgi:hypothetical protein
MMVKVATPIALGTFCYEEPVKRRHDGEGAHESP